MAKVKTIFDTILYGASIAFVGAVATFYAYSGTSNPDPLKDALRASVQLEDYCSATVIEDPDLSDGEQLTLITAKHCMGTDDHVGGILNIHLPSIIGGMYEQGQAVPVLIKDISKESDLVLLQGMNPETDPKLPKMKVYGGIPEIGDISYAIGYPRAESLTVSLGMLGYTIHAEGLGDLSESNWWQKATNAVQGGSSGGGLFIQTDEGLELVGVLTWGYKGDEGASYWTPVSEVRSFLESQTHKVDLDQNGEKDGSTEA